ncbi:DNA-binding NarL/FixJ family response regulator [Actinomadura pelletieri DSM 43383]|uniref:DNA-binding NarL/FixJ family response regulator n=1 Tax=Actinomadura pelletieri DSM 43383 TaxID=1120940 RepID=A0A495QU55_9ACTN|nr:response regulator transcription factor [Actinomadura pelletieri]RKS76977.1 DNA-binding NarL/FixJ family response regulator [Actinomadura pelletieri DSM 43383]
MTAIRVLIADDQKMVRTALRTVLGQRDEMVIVGEAEDGPHAVTAAIDLRPDVVLMDVRMPGMTGVEATRRILGGWPHPGPRPRVLMLTTFDLDEYVHAALRAGADGFILKNNTPEQLVEAINAVAAGQAMLAPTVTRRLIATVAALPPGLLTGPPRPLDDRPHPLDTLTDRERGVVLLVARGLSNGQIARRLDQSEAAVKSSVNRILTKLNLENRVQAALLVHGAGPLTPPNR